MCGHTDGSYAGPNAGSSDAVAVKLDAEGNELWTWQVIAHDLSTLLLWLAGRLPPLDRHRETTSAAALKISISEGIHPEIQCEDPSAVVSSLRSNVCVATIVPSDVFLAGHRGILLEVPT